MASIIKRGKSYCVVYDYINSDGQRKQKWETFPSKKEASVRKSEVELAQKKGTFLPPSAETVAEFMDEFVRLYGELKWSPSMYDSSTGIIRNYINPLIGDLPMQSVTVKTVDIFIHDLHRTRSAAEKYHAVKQDYISDSQVEKVFKLARCAFNQAVRWNVIPQNPFNQANLCKVKCREREIWDAETIRKALDACRDANLYVCMNLSFACSLRIGEILGLTWNNVHISEQEIKDDDAWLYIVQELARVKRSALAALNNKNIYHIFPAWTGKTTSTVLVLKKHKTAVFAAYGFPKPSLMCCKSCVKTSFTRLKWQAAITLIIIWSSPFQTDILARKSESIKPSPSSKPKPNCRMLFFIRCVIPQAQAEPRRSESDAGRYRSCRNRHADQGLCAHSRF